LHAVVCRRSLSSSVTRMGGRPPPGRPEVARSGNFLSNFCVLLKNDPLRYNFQNSVPNVFTASAIDVVTFKCRKIYSTEIGEIVCYLPDKKQRFGCLSNCYYCADRAQNLPGLAPNNLLATLQISSKSVHFRRSNSRMREHRFLPRRVFP